MNCFKTHVAALALALALPTIVAAQVPAAPVLTVGVVGQTVNASWTAVAGATSYRVEAGVSPSLMLAGYEMGATTSFSLSVPQGVYYMRVLARNASGQGAPSNIVSVQVSSSIAPPPAPTNLTATVTGLSVTFTMQLPATPLTGLVLAVGLTPGTTVGLLPLAVTAQNTVPNVPPGVYYARALAVNPGGSSVPSNEVQIVVTAPTCGPPAAPVVTPQVSGQNVMLSWNAVSGAIAYRVDVAATPGGSPIASQPVGPQTTAVSSAGVPVGTYYVRVTVANACGLTARSAEVAVTVAAAPPGTNRTPNPPPGQALPLPNRSSVVDEIARQYAGDLQNSCVASGGNNTWLFRLVQRLRTEDTRWGLNWKRGRVGDMSQDILTYNAGSEADEGTRQIYVIDVIGGHCGTAPYPAWNNVTGQGGADAIWTLQPYTAAGFPR